MPKYLVEIEEVLTYKIEVEAENVEKAIDEAYGDSKFVNNICDDNDSTPTVTLIEED